MNAISIANEEKTLVGLLVLHKTGDTYKDKIKHAVASEFSDVQDKIKAADVCRNVTPHIYIENIFNSTFYDHLLGSVKACSKYYLDLRKKPRWAGDGEHYLLAFDILKNLADEQPVEKSSLEAYALTEVLQRVGELSLCLAEKFREWIPEFTIQGNHNLKPQPYFMRDESGYGIRPHTETFSTLLTAMFYLPPDNRIERHGTVLYRPKAKGKSCLGYGEYLPLYPEEDFETGKLLQFRYNTMMAFVKTPYSWHGLPAMGELPYSRNSLTLNLQNQARLSDEKLMARLMSKKNLPTEWMFSSDH